MKKHVLILLPTYNEAENIGLMLWKLLEISESVKNYRISILVIDDKSPDGTAKIVKKYQSESKNILLVSGKKTGLGDAYIRGMKYGLEHDSYHAFIMMDADFSHDPHSIPLLLAKLSEGNDCVIGSRYAAGGFLPGNWPILRIINSRVANYIARLFGEFDAELTDLTGGFKVIKADVLRQVKLDEIRAAGYFFQVSLLYALTEQGARVAEVPISFSDRKRGSSKMSIADITEFLHKVYLLNPNSRMRRLCTFVLVGASGTLVNLVTLSFLLKLLHVNAVAADVLAIELSILTNYYLNSKYTFQSSDAVSSKKAFLVGAGKFNVGAAAGAFLSLSIFAVLFKFAHLDYVTADLLAISISVAWNYWMSVKFVWRAANANL